MGMSEVTTPTDESIQTQSIESSPLGAGPNPEEEQYLDLMRRILTSGEQQEDRTGTGTVSVFGAQMRFDVRRGFPLLTTKFVPVKSVIGEALWMISGDTNVRWLQERGITIWDEWASESGELGPVYGAQWRAHVGVRRSEIVGDMAPVIFTDQLARAIDAVRHTPGSRRIIVESWSVSELGDMALTPCHKEFQLRCSGNFLDLAVVQRSCDVFLGLPFNIAFYAALLKMIAHVTGREARELVWTGHDCHLYLDHLEQARLQVTRTPRAWPQLHLTSEPRGIDDFQFEPVTRGPKGSGWTEMGDFRLEGYHPHAHIRAKVSV